MAAAEALPTVYHETFENFMGYLLPHVEKLTEETVELMRYCVVRYGEGAIENLILTNDWFWLTRGHYSSNGTGTICDWKSSG
eukprot:4833924-Prymnesium_polylepis.1